jgi:predicted RND superfamily exporter protein
VLRLKLEYMGHKPIISKNGIAFKPAKEDKYIYLQAVSHMVSTLSKIGEGDHKYLENIDTSKKFSDNDIITLVTELRPNFEEFCLANLEEYKQKVESEEERVKDIGNLSELDKEILEENYHLMHNYRIQRATNKLVYEELINGAVDIIKKRKIEYIKVEFSREFYHIMQSLKTTIEWNRVSNSVKLSFSEDSAHIELNIGWL